MRVIDFQAGGRQDHWLAQIGKSDWAAAKFLVRHISAGTLQAQTGPHTKILMLTEGDELLSFCVYADWDCIRPTELTPWVGFVFTFPEHRGRGLIGKLFDEVRRLAQADGAQKVYLSTSHRGLYEKYGFIFQGIKTNVDGKPSRVYALPIE